MAITGTGTAKRESTKVFIDVTQGSATPEWELIGKGIPDMAREQNNEMKSEKDVVGNIEVNLTKGAKTTAVEPQNFRKESKLSQILYEIDKYDKELDEVKYPCLDVFEEDEESTGEYAAFKQDVIIDLKSWGGAATDGLTTPFDINWTGPKEHGTFNPTTKKFTPTV